MLASHRFAQTTTTKSMMGSFLDDLKANENSKWTEQDTKAFCTKVFDDIGAHQSVALEERAVSSHELKVALSARGHKFSDQETSVLMEEIDKNEDGVVAFSEFLEAMTQMVRADQRRQRQGSRLGVSPKAALIGSARMGKKAVGFGLGIIKPPDQVLECYARVAKRCETLVQHPKFEMGIVAAIFLVAIATFCEVEFSLHEYHPTHPVRVALSACATTTLTIFTLESVVKLVSFGLKPMHFFTDPDDGAFNTFDLAIVILSYATMGSGGGGLSVLRLLRLVKLMNKLPALREILLGLIAGVKAVASIMILMMLIMFFFSIVGNLLFSANDPVRMSRTC